ncbi:MAG: hypothetical protein MUP22_07455 [Desulfobacterales bacterium]|nr:hypothetical protein [Desulfobacterales bacterium]
MTDQDRLNASHEEIDKASINTKRQSIEDDFLDITALIRSIQRVEGNFDCFRMAKKYCDQVDCCWRLYCL